MSFALKIRMNVQQKYFNALRVKIGDMRQRCQSVEYDLTAIKIQNLCGEIEQTLYRCQKLL